MSARFEQILGIRFFIGSAEQAVERTKSSGGLMVAPSGPGLRKLAINQIYRQALLNADLVIADSAYMVLLWNLTQFRWIQKLSGLKYLRALLRTDEFRARNAVLWVMPRTDSAEKNRIWLRSIGIEVEDILIYIAPSMRKILKMKFFSP